MLYWCIFCTLRNNWFSTRPYLCCKSSIFRDALTDIKSATTTKPSWPIFTISESFQLRYCVTLYLKLHQKFDRSKLKVQLLLGKFRLFNFDLSYLLYPLRYRVTQYLIRQLSDMVKMGIESLAVAALLISVKASQKLKIYYINRALSKLNCYAL